MAVRAFGSSASQVTRLGVPFAQGLMAKGVAATAKHFPGLGRAVENTDFAPTTITASRPQLRADMRPFQAAIDAGVPMVMVSSAAYPALGGGKAPAALTPSVVRDELRGRLGFAGVVITDDLLTPAVNGSYSPSKAAMLASGAGVDIKLFAGGDVEGVARSLSRAASEGRIASAEPGGLVRAHRLAQGPDRGGIPRPAAARPYGRQRHAVAEPLRERRNAYCCCRRRSRGCRRCFGRAVAHRSSRSRP